MKSNIDFRKDISKGFSSRLKKVMLDKGFVSKKGKTINQPNGSILAENVAISSTMARKYLNGISVPEGVTLEKIARWLEVDPWWLLYGSKQKIVSTDETFNFELMLEIFSSMYPCFKEVIPSKHDFMDIINDCFTIYENVSVMKEPISSRSKSIVLMANFILKKLTEQKAKHNECFQV